MRKIKRPMIFETDDFIELEEHYQDRLTNMSEKSYGMNEEDYDGLRRQVDDDYKRDMEVLRYRKLHRKSWLKNKHKVIFDEEEEIEQEPSPPETEAEPQPQPIQCTALEIINRDLLTSPTEADPNASVLDEE